VSVSCAISGPVEGVARFASSPAIDRQRFDLRVEQGTPRVGDRGWDSCDDAHRELSAGNALGRQAFVADTPVHPVAPDRGRLQAEHDTIELNARLSILIRSPS